MEKQHRRALVSAYKEVKVQVGLFRLTCVPTGEVWVGMSRNIATAQNGLMFSLRQGSHLNRSIATASRAHGPDAFSYIELEALTDPDMTPLGRDTWLKDRDRHWRETLGARAIVG